MFGNTGMNDFGFDVIRPTHFGSMQREREANERSERRMAQTDRRLDLTERRLTENERHHKEQEALSWMRMNEQAIRHEDDMEWRDYKARRHEYEFDYKANERFQKQQDKNSMFNQQMAYKWAKLNGTTRREHQGGK